MFSDISRGYRQGPVASNRLTVGILLETNLSRIVILLPAYIMLCLTVQSCKLYNNKYMIASAQITNIEIFAFIFVLVFKLLSRKVLFINRKDNRNC